MDIRRLSSKNDDKVILKQKDYIGGNKQTTGSKIITQYLTQKDVAPWFRGTSHYHIQGADRLLNALRDDAEQSTTHRVRSCLNLIGLEPIITSKQIMCLMRLSRGNDLVFLWFLMEMHYKTPKHDPNSYSVNEQLICSAICHLDMITTLRELDKILPSGHTSRIEMKKAGLKREALKKSFTNRKKERISTKYVLPYFEEYPRPQQYGKRLLLEIPNFKVNFNMYSRYSNINHIVQNESNRWYADYHFNPGKRIVYSIIRETIRNIFYNFKEACARSKTIDVLCDYHKTTKITQTNLEHELKVRTRDECLKSYFKSNEGKNRHASQKEASLKTITSDCKIFDVILADNYCGCCKSNMNIIDDKIKFRAVEKNNKINNLNSRNNKIHDMHMKKCGNIRKNIYNESTNLNSKRGGNLSTTKINEVNNFECDNISDTSMPSDIVFNRPMMHKPFKFDYEKIFVSKYKDDNKSGIKKFFLAAMDKNTSNLSNQSSLKYDEAVQKCAKNMFENEVRNYEDKIRETIEAQTAEKLKPLNQYPTLANYNAENYLLMDQMLFDAFQYLRKNPKFVWAQLPDAHKIPMLREWIARRFGKEYTPRERAKSYRMSCKIFRAVVKNNLELSIPNAKHIGNNLFLNYNCRKYLDRKVQHIKNKYYHNLDSSFLEHTRVFWFAMRGYICSNGPPRKTFFAYMPSRLRDIQHLRLWKSSDYRNYKVARNVRQQNKCLDPF
ncbi:uncharacterized protein LOC119600096 [Lucilia sericata]|uniref:uncharacterized protein LOC119600096 n=1 Tax=Lucilia sericata TaxID=13632 RepID=UPI0018A827FA|nr:uncharacterized protein LOC119600096 [Lucilia sericata]